MLLLSSSAQHIYWLGRYLFRIGYVAGHLPFTDHQQAASFAQRLGLYIEDAESLNQFMLNPDQPYSLMSQLEIARDNIQELRGLLSAKAYAELNYLIKHVTADAPAIQQAIEQCSSILKDEQPEIFLFFSLGQYIEQMDTCFRFEDDVASPLESMNPVMKQLLQFGWQDLQSEWTYLKNQPDINQFYAFTYKLENQFEVYT